MKLTKRAKQVSVHYTKVYKHISEYTCPTCKVSYRGTGLSADIIRFRCACGQELFIRSK